MLRVRSPTSPYLAVAVTAAISHKIKMSRAILRPISSDCAKGIRFGLKLLANPSSALSTTTVENRKPVCLIVGSGAGIGQATAKKFASEGYHAVCVRRGKGPGRLLQNDGNMDLFVQKIHENGGSAETIFADGTKPGEVIDFVSYVEKEVGPIKVALYNIGAQIGNRSLEKTSYGSFERCLSMGVVGLFALAKEVAPYMSRRSGGGTILVTTGTAGFRGNKGQHAHSAAMGARRNLCQSLNHELADCGIHICHFNIDGVVASPETVGKLMPELYQRLVAEQSADAIILPKHVADTYYFIATQPRSNWTFEMDIRTWKETPWFNS